MRRPRMYSALVCTIFVPMAVRFSAFLDIAQNVNHQGILISRKLSVRWDPRDVFKSVADIMQRHLPRTEGLDCMLCSQKELVDLENAFLQKGGRQATASNISSRDWSHVLSDSQRKFFGEPFHFFLCVSNCSVWMRVCF